MADFVYNISKGRVAEYANRINTNDPANSVFVIGLINTSATDATLRDLDDFAAIEADANTAELTSGSNANYARKVITDASGMTITVDDTNDRVDVDIADQTWTALGAGTAVTDLVIGYDSDSTTGTDSAIRPCTQHDFAVTPDSSDATAQINVFYRAS
ncbi:hypothetical protein Drose_06205 [Dactylosporangium roseum]|uniref:Uncharacterized protein n=1 Tax=Dactylosporangium roseum TaxID=47989 RepID=A0ABY5Z891_9ACTN|nr:hypothetical protein [Dactylosporangium roseum]UWZ37864.1 hypothetical protein Drose_06205 [Dactylosporangium roseum]